MNNQEILKGYAEFEGALIYCDGELIWKERPKTTKRGAASWNTKNAGKTAGSIKRCARTTYKQLTFRGVKYLCHRVTWLLHYKKWPMGVIDHIDGNGLNNRIDNLRDVTNSINRRNSCKQINTIGHTGVYRRNDNGKWRAKIKVNQTLIELGTFKTEDQAIVARLKAEKEHEFTERHGK